MLLKGGSTLVENLKTFFRFMAWVQVAVTESTSLKKSAIRFFRLKYLIINK